MKLDTKFFKPILKEIYPRFETLNDTFIRTKNLKPREDGSPQVYHPARVAAIVGFYYPNDPKRRNKNIDIALLHDLIEDTETTYGEILINYGKEVADSVNALTNPPHLSGTGKKGQYLLNAMRNMDSDTLLVKLADRLDNISTLRAMPPEKINATLQDTKHIIAGLTDGTTKLDDEHKYLIRKINLAINELDENNIKKQK